jgi:hypothetical protein
VIRTGKTAQAPICLLLGIFTFLALSGCGNRLSAAPAGVYVDSTTEQYLQQAFDETKACTQLTQGEFEEVSVVLMPPNFPCQYYASGCSGEFVEPNLVKIGNLYVWRHELIHYLLYLNTGDPDTAHQSPLFNQCA